MSGILSFTENLGLPGSISFIFGVLPVVFVFLWTLIVIDFKNFKGSKKRYTEFSAKDPVNCFINYERRKNDTT